MTWDLLDLFAALACGAVLFDVVISYGRMTSPQAGRVRLLIGVMAAGVIIFTVSLARAGPQVTPQEAELALAIGRVGLAIYVGGLVGLGAAVGLKEPGGWPGFLALLVGAGLAISGWLAGTGGPVSALTKTTVGWDIMNDGLRVWFVVSNVGTVALIAGCLSGQRFTGRFVRRDLWFLVAIQILAVIAYNVCRFAFSAEVFLATMPALAASGAVTYAFALRRYRLGGSRITTLARLFEISNVPTITLDLLTNQTSLNPAARSLLGHRALRPDEVSTALGLLEGQQAPPRRSTDWKLFPEVHFAGRCYEVNCTHFDDLQFGLILLIDVTERVEVQRTLRESREKYRQLVDHAPAGLYEIDLKKTRFLQVNDVMCEYTGYTRAEFLTLDPMDLLTAESKQLFMERMQRFACGEAVPETTEFDIRAKDGRPFSVLVNSRLSFDEHGDPVKATVVCHDITQRKRLERELARADRLASVGMLAASIAHEVNNPLTYVSGNLEYVLAELPRALRLLPADEEDSRATATGGGAGATDVGDQPASISSLGAELMECLSDASAGAARVQQIVKDMSAFARVSDEPLEPVDITAAIDKAVSMADNHIRYRARLVKEYGDLPPVLANENRLCQIFLNLLVNAAQSIREGDVRGNEIRIRTWVNERGAIVEIRDTGRGMSTTEREQVFDPFFTTKPKGMGLGLVISYNLVQSYGGRIEIESAVGQGTVVRVELPIGDTPISRPRPLASAEPRIAKPDGSRPRILVVDDEPGITALTKRILGDDCEVVAAQSGAGAQQFLEKDAAFDLVLCDLIMPEGTGMDLYQWVEAEKPALQPRMAFMTGGAFTERSTEFCVEVNAITLEKPFTARALKDLVNRLLTDSNRARP